MQLLTVLLTASLIGMGLSSYAAPRAKVILDTDIGDDIDDIYALALLASRPEVDLLGVTTAFGETDKRAELAAKFLWVMGRRSIPVHAGRAGEHKITRQHEWVAGFRSRAIKKTPAVEFLRREILRAPGQITIVPIGALTNIGDLLTQYPEVKPHIKRIVLMGGAAYVGYNNEAPPVPEWNIRCDPAAARLVFESGVPIVMAPLDSTTMMVLDEERQKKMAASGSRTCDAISALRLLWGLPRVVLYDAVPAAYVAGHLFAEERPIRVRIEDDGMTRVIDGPPNAVALVNPKTAEFLDWYVDAMKAAP